MNKSKPKIPRVCEVCGAKFEVNESVVKRGSGKYCSRTCRHAVQNHKQECICLTCGKPFMQYQYYIDWGWAKYCSKECGRAARNKTCTCLTCGMTFTRYRSRDRKYCSQDCYNSRVGKDRSVVNSKTRTLVDCQCVLCGKLFQTLPSEIRRGGGKYCNRKCFGLAKRGAGSSRWRGGKFYTYGLNWETQRQLAYDRDGGICQNCGLTEEQAKKKYGYKNPVHHIIARRTFHQAGRTIEESNATTNLITLCRSCHTKAESGKIVLQPRLI